MASVAQKKNNPIKKLGLAGKLSGLVSLIALLVYIPSIIFGAYKSLQESKYALEQYKQSLEIRVQSAFEPAIWNYDIETLRKLITNELKNKNLRCVQISSIERTIIKLMTDGEKVFESRINPEGPYIERHIIPIHKFNDHTQIIAYATLWYDHTESRNQFLQELKDEIIQMGIVILLIATALTLLSYIRLVRPLESIRMSMIEAGKSSHSLAKKKMEAASFRRAFSEIKSMASDLERMLQDIDAAQQQTRASEAQLRAIFQQAGVGVGQVSAQSGRYIFLNQRFCDIVGYTMEEMMEMSYETITHKDDLPKQQALIEKLLGGMIREHSIEKRYIRKDGQMVWVEMTISPLWSEGEEPTTQIVVIQDITARKKAEAEIKKLNDELEDKVAERTVELEQANCELESAIEDLREAQHQLVNQEKMAVLGQLVAGIAHELNTPLGVINSAGGTLEKVIKNEIDQVVQFRVTAPEEIREVYNRLVAQSMAWESTQDLSSRRQNRKRYYKMVEENNLSISDEVVELLVDIGYEASDEEFLALIGQPGIKDAVKMAYSIITMHKSAHMIRISAEKASKVIMALKTYSHQESNRQVVPHDVINDIEMVLTLYYNQTKYGVEITKDYQEVPPVLCYPDKLHQVWVNIINNALQAMDYKGKLIIGIARTQEYVKVSITDKGPGIPETIRKRIFEPFFTTKKLGEGTGLGLDIAKRIVEEVGGHIDVETQPGETTFSIWLRVYEEVI